MTVGVSTEISSKYIHLSALIRKWWWWWRAYHFLSFLDFFFQIHFGIHWHTPSRNIQLFSSKCKATTTKSYSQKRMIQYKKPASKFSKLHLYNQLSCKCDLLMTSHSCSISTLVKLQIHRCSDCSPSSRHPQKSQGRAASVSQHLSSTGTPILSSHWRLILLSSLGHFMLSTLDFQHHCVKSLPSLGLMGDFPPA